MVNLVIQIQKPILIMHNYQNLNKDLVYNNFANTRRFNDSFNFNYIKYIRPVVAQGHKDCKIECLWVRSPLEKMKYLFKCIFPFILSGIKANRGIEFRHSTRNAFKIRRKVRNGVS